MIGRAVAAALLGASASAEAGGRYCDRPADVDAVQQARFLRVAAVIKQVLDQSGRQAALVARSGLDLDRFRIRYSHAGIALKHNPGGAWAVRQLYYACDESRPRLFDQGMTGFLLGTDDPSSGYVSLLLLPDAEDGPLAAAALDRPRALALLADDYSANAHAHATRYQNCNQWVMELLAAAWGPVRPQGYGRDDAQRWLAAQGYAPEPVDVGSHALMFAAQFVPLLHVDDHPLEDLQSLKLRISMPASIETFARQHAPTAERVELCHDERHIVVRRGGAPIGAGCEAGPGDEVIELQAEAASAGT